MVLRGTFTFDPGRHRYAVGGWPVPSITRLVKDKDAFTNPIYLARGSAVHKAALQFDLGAAWTLPGEWLPFMRAYEQFRAEVACRWRQLEQPLVNRRLRYAGTPDRIGTVNQRPVILEIKTGYPDLFHGPQLAGQDLLLPGGGDRSPRRRMAVYLSKEGRYKLVEYSAAADYLVFMDALRRYWAARDRKESDDDNHGDSPETPHDGQ